MLDSHKDYCPYCGEIIELLIDESMVEEEYIEDCEVCCRPIAITVHGQDASNSQCSEVGVDQVWVLTLRREDE